MLEALSPSGVWDVEGGVCLRCGDITFFAECPHRDTDRLVREHDAIPVQLEMADDTMILVAFSSSERRKLYRALRAISGIGRRSALLVLDCGEVIDTLRAASGRDHDYFHEVPGLGKARIGAIIAELEKRYKETLPTPLPMPVRMWVEARDALLHHDKDLSEAENMLRRTLDTASPPRSAEELTKTAIELSQA